MSDALIAATAAVNLATLVTLNERHLLAIRDMAVPNRKGR